MYERSVSIHNGPRALQVLMDCRTPRLLGGMAFSKTVLAVGRFDW